MINKRASVGCGDGDKIINNIISECWKKEKKKKWHNIEGKEIR